MNYYNPYYMMAPVASTRPSLFGLLSRGAGRGLSLSTIINGTQKTLGLVNQAIPIVKQVTPVMRNAKTMFKVMNEFKKVDTNVSSSNDSVNVMSESMKVNEDVSTEENSFVSNGGPTFFV